VTLREALQSLTQRLRGAAGDLAEREAESILQAVLGCERHDLYRALSPPPLATNERERAFSVAERRASGMPLPYILGSTYFHSCELSLSPDVLIPRYDTEVLVETVLEAEPQTEAWFLDLCSGSGALAATLLANRPRWRCIASDVSIEAARIARRNTTSAAAVVAADMLRAFRPGAGFDFVVCNPPYIPSDEIPGLEASVRDFEPWLALDGGADGLRAYRAIAEQAPAMLRASGRLYMEIGWNQAESVTAILEKCGWCAPEVRADLAGRPRVVCAGRPDGA
jgi:release factor glutamine methyltransferase